MSKKILVIEDEKSLRREVADILSFEGYSVIEAINGSEGYAKAAEELPDLILCDIMMPEMDGYEVLSELRRNESTKLIPLIFLTAFAERDKMRSGMEMGADDYLVKPFERSELLKAVDARIKISESVMERSAQAMDELRYNLIHHLPHELRTPLNGIIGFGQLLMEADNSITIDQITDYGKIIYDSGMRLNRLFQNYLLYVQLELKKDGLSQAVPIKDADVICMDIMLRTSSKYNRESDVEFNVAHSKAYMGSLELGKIVEEIADNAFKFSGKGTKVKLSCMSDMEYFNLSISDSGIGMSQSDIKKIGAYMQFNRFFNEQQGLGLGLTICKRITDLYDGELNIHSEEGVGTKVEVRVPIKIF